MAEKEKFERTQTEANNQLQAQLDAAMKQIRNLVQKSEEMDEKLKEARKSNEGTLLFLLHEYSGFINFSFRFESPS